MPSWEEFQYQDHSLIVYASDVAACTGFHEYKSCPDLMMKHCYQGVGGSVLLRHDMELLGLTMVSEEEQLLDIARAAGPSTVQAIRDVLQVKYGQKTLQSIEAAKQVQQTVLQTAKASKKLSNHQIELLAERTRQSIDTGCGHSWENDALDQYEKQCGWEVYERNVECRVWHFQATEKEWGCTSTTTGMQQKKTLQAVGPAYAPTGDDHRRGIKRKTIAEQTVTSTDPPCINFTEETKNSEQGDAKFLVDLTVDRDLSADSIRQGSNSNISNEMKVASGDVRQHQYLALSSNLEDDDGSHPHRRQSNRSHYYLTIRGMVDGVRDELAPRQQNDSHDHDDDNNDDDDDSWILRRVIVECKHRMRTVLPTPRFYECIQAVVYCFMYDAEEADIIQVLRTVKRENKSETSTTKKNKTRGKCDSNSGTLTHGDGQERVKHMPPQIDGMAQTVGHTTMESFDGGNTAAKHPSSITCLEGSQKQTYLSDFFDVTQLLPSKPAAKVDIVAGDDGKNTDKIDHSDTPSIEEDHPTTMEEEQSSSTTSAVEGDSKDGGRDGDKKRDAHSDPVIARDHKATTTSSTTTAATTAALMSMEISVNRISLHDKTMGHKCHWDTTILPNLRQWADAVYRIRQSDEKRYRFLSAMAKAQSYDDVGDIQRRKAYMKVAWNVILTECPFLKDGYSGERYRLETQ